MPTVSRPSPASLRVRVQSMMPAATPPSTRRPYRKHGAFALKRAIRTLGSRTIDRRTKVGRALAAWCEDLACDLGGADALSTQQKAIVEQAATTRLLLDSIDGWLVTQPSLVDRRKRALLPVVRERQSLADALVRYLTALGLERKALDALPAFALEQYLAMRERERASDEHADRQQDDRVQTQVVTIDYTKCTDEEIELLQKIAERSTAAGPTST